MDIMALGLAIRSEEIQPAVVQASEIAPANLKSDVAARLAAAANLHDMAHSTGRYEDRFQTTTALSSGGVIV